VAFSTFEEYTYQAYMSKITIILLLCLCGFKSLAQDIDFDKQLGTDYADFDLSKYIKTKYDFDQSKMTEADIDKKIEEIAVSQSDKSFLDIELPINYKKINYMGFIYPTETKIFQYSQVDMEKNSSILKKNLSFTSMTIYIYLLQLILPKINI